ncbi:transporter substrate-binding domain-containing protein [Flavimaribacter sediminis]|nr:transporter substrate-binding domain-containing protein [Flavimaribacter sediminis]
MNLLPPPFNAGLTCNPAARRLRRAWTGSISAFLFLLLAFAMLSPAAAQQVTAPSYWDPNERIGVPDLSARGRILFVTTADFPPFNFLDQQNRLAGFHVELVRAICEELKVLDRCQIQLLPWEELEAAIADGKADAIVAGVAITAEAREKYDFTRPFLKLPARFARNEAVAIDGDDAAALAGHRVGVIAGTAHEAMLRAFFPEVQPVIFDKQEWMYDGLKKGDVDAVFADGVQLSFWLGSQDADGCCAFFDGPYLSRSYLGEGLAIAVNPKDPELVQALDHALLAMTRNGRMTEIYRRAFPYGLY